MQNALEKCLKLAKPAPKKEIEQAAETLDKLDNKISELATKRSEMFGFERNAAGVLEQKIKKLKTDRAAVRSLTKYGQYGRLEFAPLKWRDKDGYPSLVLMTLDSPKFIMGIRTVRQWGGSYRYANVFEPKLPLVLKENYADVAASLKDMAKDEKKSVYLSTEFSGMIPDDARATIVKAQSEFSQIFLLAEANKWQLEKKAPKVIPVNTGDPIIAGFDGTNLWVVGSFDLTSLERLVKSEFTT